MTRRERLRRVSLTCSSFVRNFAYYRAGQSDHGERLHSENHIHASFWRQINNNFLDLCVLEWCKLFGNRRGNYSCSKIIIDAQMFENEMLSRLGIDAVGFQRQIDTMRRYRDKFVAHLDDDKIMCPPGSMLRTKQFYFTMHISCAMR